MGNVGAFSKAVELCKQMSSIKERFEQVNQRIRQAKATSNRTDQVCLLAVSKKKSVAMIQRAYELGQRDFGESYVQEALTKIESLSTLSGIYWHFIGPIQSNKTRDIASGFSWVHSVDRLKVAQRLNDQRPLALPALNVCLQVNLNQEAGKSGVSINALPELVNNIIMLPRLKLRGLMIIPAKEQDPIKQREPFKALAELLASLNHSQHLSMDTLSMGMTNDLDAAIAEGATMVRIGTALFGARH
ncbi:MAG: YggS family pyridoxal phosphate-dependent enzyme [Endozoicomonas sp. (ex Botrylloides leachii)]|nr:YggS family pyridoxal phosphate-dependent enzyme [Endozoicomonas sp. (ex Botrylloides leachii)]